MKAPSKNISKSLDGQRLPGREVNAPSVERPAGSPSMTVPGEGGVSTAPGAGMAPRGVGSAKKFADANGGRFGGGS